MQIKDFLVEDWCNKYEYSSKYNLGETCISSFKMNEFFELAGLDASKVWDELGDMQLTYGNLYGSELFRKGVASLFKKITIDDITTAHGCAGANYLTFSALVEPGTHVISILPTYQQLYSIPEAMGADLDVMRLKKENEFLPDLNELRSLVRKDTKLIVINNPHNPSGNLLPTSMLEEIAEIARSVGAYVLSDETYRHLTSDGSYMESMADIYEKGISVGSMTKVFALAGLRLGWVVTRDKALQRQLEKMREYSIITCSMVDEFLGGLVLAHKDVVLKRSRDIMNKNRQIVKEWIQTQPHLKWVEPKAATMCMIYYDFDMPSYEFCEKIQNQESVFLMPGASFDLPENCFRLGYSCGTQELIDGLAATDRFIKSLNLD